MFIKLRLYFYFAELEWMLSEVGALSTTLEENPHKKVDDVMSSAIRSAVVDSDSDDGFN